VGAVSQSPHISVDYGTCCAYFVCILFVSVIVCAYRYVNFVVFVVLFVLYRIIFFSTLILLVGSFDL